MIPVKTYHLIFFYLFSLIMSLLLMFTFELGYEKISLTIIEVEIILILIFLIYHSYKKNGIISLYTLFLFFSIFFIFSRIIFEFIGYLGRQVNDFYFFLTNIHFKDETVFKFMFYSIIYFLSIDAGTHYQKKEKKILIPVKRYHSVIKVILTYIVILLLPLLLYKGYLDIQNVSLNGYRSVLDRTSYPFYLKGIGTIFISCFFVFFMFQPERHEVIFIISIYIIYSFSASLRGSRSVFFIPFIFSIYLLWKMKIIKITFKGLFVIGFCCILLIAWFTSYLRGEAIQNLGLGDLIKYVLYGQGNSIGLPLYYLEFKDVIDSQIQLPLIIEDWGSFFFDSLHRGSYYIAQIANKNGVDGGLGESIFLELLNLPLPLAIIISFCLGKIIKYIDLNIFCNAFSIPLFLLISQWVFVLPRFALFNFLDIYGIVELILSYSLYFSLVFFIRYLKEGKSNAT